MFYDLKKCSNVSTWYCHDPYKICISCTATSLNDASTFLSKTGSFPACVFLFIVIPALVCATRVIADLEEIAAQARATRVGRDHTARIADASSERDSRLTLVREIGRPVALCAADLLV